MASQNNCAESRKNCAAYSEVRHTELSGCGSSETGYAFDVGESTSCGARRCLEMTFCMFVKDWWALLSC